MALITLMACVDFFENRYLRAIKNGKFIFFLNYNLDNLDNSFKHIRRHVVVLKMLS
jgi:hypothetical protein